MSNRDCCHSSKKDESVAREESEVGFPGSRRHGFRCSNVDIPHNVSVSSDCASERKEEAILLEEEDVDVVMTLRKRGFQSLYVEKKSDMDEWSSSVVGSIGKNDVDEDDENSLLELLLPEGPGVLP